MSRDHVDITGGTASEDVPENNYIIVIILYCINVMVDAYICLSMITAP